MSDWMTSILGKMPRHRLQDGIAIDSDVIPEPGYWNIDYESILADPYRTVSAEHPFYVAAIKDAVGRLSQSSDRVVADLGCGDGRFTRLLMQLKCPRVVAMDLSRANLQRLVSRVSANSWSKNVLLVEGDVRDPPLPRGWFDLVTAIGVLLVLGNDYAKGVGEASKLVRPGGYLLTVDPTDFGSAMYAIVRHDLNELGKVLREHTKTVDIARNDAPRYSIRSANEMTNAHTAAGMEVVAVRGIPLFPSLLFGGMKQMKAQQAEDLIEMKHLCEMLNNQYPDCWRAACVLSRKPQS